MIPYGVQDIRQEDIDAVVSVLKSSHLTQGPVVERFEGAVSKYCGAGFAVAVNSATSALHLACLALDVGPGDIVWTSPNTFVASANCALYCGADVDFVDIDPRTLNISIEELRNKLIDAERNNQLPKVVIPVHFAGQSCQMEEMASLAQEYGFRIIEDASHAIGGRYNGQPVGACGYSDITVFSLHPVKIITSGEGGLLLTNHPDLAARMRDLRSHGITRNPENMVGECEGGWYYQQRELGFNYRLTDIQAALGLAQLGRVDEYVNARSALAVRYDELLAPLPLATPDKITEAASAWHLYVVRLDCASSQLSRKAVFDAMRSAGIGVNVHYIPVHLQPYYTRRGFKDGDYPAAESYYKCALTLPLHPKLSHEHQDFIVHTLTGCLS